MEVSASDYPAAVAADVPPGDPSATSQPEKGNVEGGGAPPVAGLAAASSDAAAVGGGEVRARHTFLSVELGTDRE